jgi:hypothetical protein
MLKKPLPKMMIYFSQGIVVVLGLLLGASSSWAKGYNKEKIYQYLKSQQNIQTGLVNSFLNTSDEMLFDQASTYDQSLAAITFLLNKDEKAASRILDFFSNHWNGIGFSNFYHTKRGEVGLEATIHLGPNAWIALAALRYDAMTGTKKYYPLARKITVWMAGLPHDKTGGIAMGPSADWGADWRTVFSAENNIDAYVVFQAMAKLSTNDDDKNFFLEQAKGIKAFLKKEIFSLKPRIPVGPDTKSMASDVFAFSLLAFSAQELRDDFLFAPEDMFQALDQNFLVETDDIFGYDFTDFLTKTAFERRPMISMEWSAMVALSYLKIGQECRKLYSVNNDQASKDEADVYVKKANKILEHLDQKAMVFGASTLAYPYATKAWEQVFPFATWWRTPQRGDQGRLAGSLSGTCWRVFAEEQFNPFDL